MDPAPIAFDDVAALKAALIAERARRLEVAAELAVAQAKASENLALIAAQKLRIAKLERQVYGQRSERSARLIDQLALEFEELAASATENELAAEQAAAKTTTVRPFTRRRAERDTFPDHLPRERVVIDPPTACACCGGNRLRKLGEDVTQAVAATARASRWRNDHHPFARQMIGERVSFGAAASEGAHRVSSRRLAQPPARLRWRWPPTPRTRAPAGRSDAPTVPTAARRPGARAWRSGASARRSAPGLPTLSLARPLVPPRLPGAARARRSAPPSGGDVVGKQPGAGSMRHRKSQSA